MRNDDKVSNAETKVRITRAENRAFLKEFKLDRPLPSTPAVVNARARAQKWRDERHDSGIPDNRLLGNLAFKTLLRVDAEKRAAGKPGLDRFFEAMIDELPSRFDFQATAKLLEKYREQALEQLPKG